MKKILERRNIFFCILLFVPIFLFSFFTNIDAGDEIINFQSVIKMVNGNLIYRDFNVIVTPLFFIIGKGLLYLFGSNIFLFRIYNVFIFAFLFISIYLLLKKLKISKSLSIFTILVFLLFLSPYIKVGANYNILAIALYIFGIYIYKKENTIKNIFLQSLAMFLIFFTKQNIGIYYVIAIILSNLFLDTKNLKENIKLTIKEISIFLIFVLISSIIMFAEGNFFDFINYAFLGMSEFTQGNFAIAEDSEVLILIYFLSSILIYALYLFLIKKHIIYDANEKNIFIFSIFLNITAFPIINMYHSSFAIILNLVMLVIIINKEIHIKEKIWIVANIFLFIAINIYGLSGALKLTNSELIVDKNSKYYGGFINQDLKNEISNITNYILEENDNGNRVIVFSEKAALYMVELNLNNGEFDLPFVGNLGKDGENKLIEKIKNLENTKILLDREIYWQIPLKVREFIITNLKNIGDIGGFKIYE